ncbi:uncharacterized protein N7515_007011 [Penicillium bovifimosum]|uniref:Calcineurin-like phosphoesterase domain-containing protein n=1 Tax=Penicillium bovifimosum TaxID=126998 RepID=A0A9W9GVU3_9EURO|nr:uncharacterized protein N7515_007011 [Penicillium bovifimosum]KAJ5130972.1 hypothetical protein N7515_007011 [Penicillium bovifimosum]
MFLRGLLSRLLALLLPLAVTATVYLYLYPVFKGCAFPLPPDTQSNTKQSPGTNAVINTLLQHLNIPTTEGPEPAIFRLLVLADPQLEGDTSLPFPEYDLYPRLQHHWRTVQDSISNSTTLLNTEVLSTITTSLQTLATEDIPRSFNSAVKRLDLFGNDYYLAHIYRTLFLWTRPTHTTVLGDLVGSQWISDDEFATRGHRYWNRVFRGAERVDDTITRTGVAGFSQSAEDKMPPTEPLRGDGTWARRLINVAGNHDIGYAGDISEARMERFERVFGRANWDIRFEHPAVESPSASGVVVPTLHLINLNSLMFDTPVLSSEIQSQTYAYLNELIAERLAPVEDRSAFTLLLTHLPMHKEEGICTDGPFFSFHDLDDEAGPDGVPRWLEGGLKEQNHLSDALSASGILQGVFGLSGNENAVAGGQGRNGLILTGHDHTGCDVVHYVNRTAGDEEDEKGWKWDAKRFDSRHIEEPSIREVTLRSMMGEFGGNAGLLSAWFDQGAGEWSYEITMCPAGVQHIWWAVHVLVLVTLVVAMLSFLVGVWSKPAASMAQTDKSQVVQKK